VKAMPANADTVAERADALHGPRMPGVSKGALTGLRVIDLTRVYAGPLCTQTLADQGADVIKVEPPAGDETRDWGTKLDGDRSTYFNGLNRNKRSVALDLQLDEGRQVLLRLLDDADVLVHNFKLGTLPRWGLGYANVLSKRFPRLVQCTITGFGDSGPLAGMPGYDVAVQGFVGLASINGQAGSEGTKLGVPLIDHATGLSAVNAILMALFERDRSGMGQHVAVSLYNIGLTMLHPASAAWMATGKIPRPNGNAEPWVAPYGAYACRDGRVFTGAGNDQAFAKLCAALGIPELAADPRFRTNADRVEHRSALDAAITARTEQHDASALATSLMQAGLAAGPFLNMEQVFNHPQVRANDMLIDAPGYRGTGLPLRLLRTPGAYRSAPPHFAAHTEEVLGQAGFSTEQIAGLEQRGVAPRERRSITAEIPARAGDRQ
jgi:crotonobetainyl-CoA:carnitine CoA-transferase CaiB-like acyl-CoA transferase